MDGHLGIEHNRQALIRILATLVAMATMAARPHPGGSPNGQDQWLAPIGEGEHRTTLPRRLRNAVLRLLRPAESATRRLVIAFARGLTVVLPAQRKLGPKPGSTVVSDGQGTGIVMPRDMARPAERKPPRRYALPLIDPLPRPFARRTSYMPAHRLPRISAPGISDRPALPTPPSPDDRLDASRLRLRLAALGAALDDLPRQALRFARWQARQKRARDAETASSAANAGHLWKPTLRWPLRRGRPPGSGDRNRHEVHDILFHADALAGWALSHPDTS